MELVDTLDLKSNGYFNARAGSSPARGTNPYSNYVRVFLFIICGKSHKLLVSWAYTFLNEG